MAIFKQKYKLKDGTVKESKNWYISYTYKGKLIKKAIGPSYREAERALIAAKSDIIRRTYSIPDKKQSILFNEFGKEYLNHAKNEKTSWKTDEHILKHLKDFFKNKHLSDITPFLIEKYKIERKKNVKQSTINRELTVLKRMFTLAVKWGRASENPVKEVRFYKIEDKPIRTLSREGEIRLIEVAAPHIKPILVTALNTGMRKGEILSLTWDNVDLGKNPFILITQTKSKKHRIVPINNTLKKTLKKLKIKGRKYVFANSKDEPYGDIKKGFKAACNKAGIKNLRFHDLRHTFATRLVTEYNVDLVTVKELLGHSSLEMTLRYSHTSEELKRRAVESFNTNPILMGESNNIIIPVNS